MVRVVRMLPGDPAVTLRLPSILGYLLTLLGVHLFAKGKLPLAAGLIAASLVAYPHSVLTPWKRDLMLCWSGF